MDHLVKAEDVAIAYKLGDFKDIGLKEWVTRHLTHNYRVEQFMAVDGVSFELRRGDFLGIVGANGAGKSTLLKAVAGIMEPRRGTIDRQGSVSALLELGSGFDGELTVKENAYLRGAMLGYTRQFMNDTYGEIIAFAELEHYEDRPFKQLSSGMQARLAFSIASLVQPEILILDEVLSVGDGAFQEKSARKMREIIDKGAATIFVSHSLDQVRALSTRVLWLHHGRQIALGPTQAVCDRYQAFLNGDEAALSEDWVKPEDSCELLPHMSVSEGVCRMDGGLLLPPRSFVFGPYVEVPVGEYRFTAELDGAEDLAPHWARITADFGNTLLCETPLVRGRNEITLRLDKKQKELELVLPNDSSQPILLTSLRVEPGLHPAKSANMEELSNGK